MTNAMNVINPYWHEGTWVFDDDRHGLVREPFVLGVPEMIDDLVEDIPDARSGFRLIFSDRGFPQHDRKLTWVREESEGNWYRTAEPEMEGWLCPALLHFFEQPPNEIYVKAEPLARE